MQREVTRIIEQLTQTFDSLGVDYMIGGSVASSIRGIYRYTNDVDIVAALREEHIAPFVATLENDYYVDADMIRDALQEKSSFNVIQLETMTKADIFIKQDSAWTDAEWKRKSREQIGEDTPLSVFVASAEDMILQKLRWYRLGGGVSDRQWNDITGMLKVHTPELDYAYLRTWAENLELTDLLAQAYDDSGLPPASASIES